MRTPKRQDSGSFFNNLSVLKRAIYYYGPQTVAELVEHIRKELPYKYDSSTIEGVYVVPALEKRKYFLMLGDGRWDIEWDQAQLEENRTAEKVLRAEKSPLSLMEIRKRVGAILAKDSADVRIDLENDPKFTAVGTQHYALSEWQLLNDHAYELLAQEPGRYLTEQEILRRLVSVHQLVSDAAVFCPKVDSRFKKGANATWGLHEWAAPRVKDVRQLIDSLGLMIPIQVTPEQMARVASMAPVIDAYILASRDAVRPRHLVENVLTVQVGAADYPALIKAVITYLTTQSRFLKVGEDSWRLKAQVPPEVWKAESAMAFPRVRASFTEDIVTEDFSAEAAPRQPSSGTAERTGRSLRIVLTFTRWRAGTLGIPASNRALFAHSPEDVTELHMLISGSVSNEFPVWFNRVTHTIYGLRSVYDALGMVPGSVFHLSLAPHRVDHVNLHFAGELDQKVLREQSRLFDPHALNASAKAVGQPFRDILVSIVRQHPSGIGFWAIFDEVTKVRPVAIATLRNLLSSVSCFYQTNAGSGIWYYDPSKPIARERRKKLSLRAPHILVRPTASAGSPTTTVSAAPSSSALTHVQPQLNDNHGVDDCGENGDLTGNVPHSEKLDSYNPAHTEALDKPTAGAASASHSMQGRISTLLSEGFIADKPLIREYLRRYHSVHIDERFVASVVPPPETIRRSRQLLLNTRDTLPEGPDDISTVRGKVLALLRDEQLRVNDRRLIMEYYRQFHGIRVSEDYLIDAVPSMETIRRTRQRITRSHRDAGVAGDDETDPDWEWPGRSWPGQVSRLSADRRSHSPGVA